MSDNFVFYIISDNNRSLIDRSLSLFENRDNITIEIPTIIIPPKFNTNYDLCLTYKVLWILDDSKRRYQDFNTFILLDSSLSLIDPSRVSDIILGSVSLPNWDLIFFNKNLERCDLFRDQQEIGDVSYVRNFNPNNIQSTLFSPNGRDILLGLIDMPDGNRFKTTNLFIDLQSNLISENIISYVTTVNIFVYDILLNPDNINRVSDCAKIKEVADNNLFVYVSIVFILVIIFWFIF